MKKGRAGLTEFKADDRELETRRGTSSGDHLVRRGQDARNPLKRRHEGRRLRRMPRLPAVTLPEPYDAVRPPAAQVGLDVAARRGAVADADRVLAVCDPLRAIGAVNPPLEAVGESVELDPRRGRPDQQRRRLQDHVQVGGRDADCNCQGRGRSRQQRDGCLRRDVRVARQEQQEVGRVADAFLLKHHTDAPSRSRQQNCSEWRVKLDASPKLRIAGILGPPGVCAHMQSAPPPVVAAPLPPSIGRASRCRTKPAARALPTASVCC